ncbi:MAG: DNA repair protein RadA [Pseudomonadota bacterium]
MAKAKTAYVCSDCGAHSVKWAGQCPECGVWNTLSEVRISASGDSAGGELQPASLGQVAGASVDRIGCGFGEFDRVLGGGLLPGAVILLGGDPGVGKSTLLQQVSASLADSVSVVYATGEESLRQVGERANRLNLATTAMQLLADTSIDNIIAQAAKATAQVLIVDSIQTMSSDAVPSAPGSVAQLRDCVGRLVQFAKQNDVAVFLIGHVTKDGTIAGPRVVEHMVDTVLYIERDASSRYTLIRSVKNRFGATGEMGVFAMQDIGFREVNNPSAIFLPDESTGEPGSTIAIPWEGSRALLVEVQALVADSASTHTRRLATGMDSSRLAMLLAVLQRHADLALGAYDVFVNVVGGLRITETAIDLPAALAIASSYRNRRVVEGAVSFGEIGLAGEVRPVPYGEERIEAAIRQGLSRVICPEANVPRRKVHGIEVTGVRRLRDAIEAIT